MLVQETHADGKVSIAQAGITPIEDANLTLANVKDGKGNEFTLAFFGTVEGTLKDIERTLDATGFVLNV